MLLLEYDETSGFTDLQEEAQLSPEQQAHLAQVIALTPPTHVSVLRAVISPDTGKAAFLVKRNGGATTVPSYAVTLAPWKQHNELRPELLGKTIFIAASRCDEVEVAWNTNSELVITAAGQPKQHLSEHLNVTIRVQQP